MRGGVVVGYKCVVCCGVVFFFNDTATTEIYTLSLHDALPICTLANMASSFSLTSGVVCCCDGLETSVFAVAMVAAGLAPTGSEDDDKRQKHKNIINLVWVKLSRGQKGKAHF